MGFPKPLQNSQWPFSHWCTCSWPKHNLSESHQTTLRKPFSKCPASSSMEPSPSCTGSRPYVCVRSQRALGLCAGLNCRVTLVTWFRLQADFHRPSGTGWYWLCIFWMRFQLSKSFIRSRLLYRMCQCLQTQACGFCTSWYLPQQWKFSSTWCWTPKSIFGCCDYLSGTDR